MADESSETSDESLDATSDKFDPLKALYSFKMRLPSSDAPIYDNVSKYESASSDIGGTSSRVCTIMH